MTRLRIEIERLVLTGVAPGDRAGFAQALEQSLARALSEPAVLRALAAGQGSQLLHLDGGRLRWPDDGGAAQQGTSSGQTAAQAIVRGITT